MGLGISGHVGLRRDSEQARNSRPDSPGVLDGTASAYAASCSKTRGFLLISGHSRAILHTSGLVGSRCVGNYIGEIQECLQVAVAISGEVA